MAGMAAFVLLLTALIMDAGEEQIATAAVFYLLGVIGGLFGLVYYNQKSDSTVEDYGLGRARLLRTLVFSGLAGVIAAVLIPMLAATADQAVDESAITLTATATPTVEQTMTPEATDEISTPEATEPVGGVAVTATVTPTAEVTATPSIMPTPTPSSAVSLSGGNEGVPPLESFFDIHKRPVGVVLAFIFGISPDALLAVAGRRVEQLKKELKGTEAAEAPADDEDEE
jgi:hypothetical protein